MKTREPNERSTRGITASRQPQSPNGSAIWPAIRSSPDDDDDDVAKRMSDSDFIIFMKMPRVISERDMSGRGKG